METLEWMRRRIATVEDLRTIVRTMKSLSAVGIRQADNAVAALVDYNHTVELGLYVVLNRRQAPTPPKGVQQGVTAAVVFGSDYGLCGRFNDAVAHFARRKLDELDLPRDRRLFLAVGARAAARLEALGETVEAVQAMPGAVGGLTATAQTILVTIDAWQATRDVTRVLVMHNRRSGRILATPQMTQVLPVELWQLRRLAERRWPSRRLPTFTMDPERLFAALIRQYLFVAIFRAGAESMASEHARRLASMQVAERNIDERLEDMNAAYRRQRQDSITEELLDVISGYETLHAGGP